MPAPSIFAVIRHILSRALRETGQALDRVGVRGVVHAHQGRRMGDDNPYWFNDHLSRHRGIMGLLRRGYPIVPGITAGSASTNARLAGGEHSLVEHGQAQNVAFLAPCATLIGNVQLAPNTSIFYKAILKADVAAYGVNTIHSAEEEERWKSLPVGGYERKRDAGMLDAGNGIGHPTIGGANGGGIYVGEGTNIQDACMVTSYEGHSTIGKYVTVGHGAQIHSATVGDESLIGMGAILKPGCVIESQSFIAAGAVIERGCVVNSGEIWGGNPAKKLRELTAEEKAKLRVQAEKYISVGNMHSHCMELGGNIPDSFLEETDLIEIGAAEDGTKKQLETTLKDERTQLDENSQEEGVRVKIQ
jgi:carbonic anhydrase/acetyltransferase-like protein (isoleucine patch superfamily)